MEVLRGGGSIEPNASTSATGDTVMVSIRLGVDEHVRAAEPTFPNWNGGNELSALDGRCVTVVEEKYPLLRVRVGRVTGRLLLCRH